MLDVKAFGDGFIAAVKGYVSGAIDGVSKRIDQLEQRLTAIPSGKSAYEIAVARGFAGSENEWIESLRGATVKGDPGPEPDFDAISRQISDGIDVAVAKLPVPKDGASVTVDDVAPLIAVQVRSAIEALPIPKDGKDADPAAIAEAVAAAVAELPKPQDGKSIELEDVAPLISDAVKSAVDALPPPADGKDVDMADVARMVSDAVGALPVPVDGKSITVEDVAPLIVEEVQRAVAALPVPAAGKDADPAVIASAVAAAVQELPRPKDGASVTVDDMRPVVLEAVKAAVAEIPVPADGKSVSIEEVSLILEGAQAKWALDFERRAADVLQRAIDRMPAAKDGRDAFDLDDIDLSQSEDGRTITLSFRRGEEVREKSFTLDVVLDRGVYRSDTEYAKGDAVTFGGSVWIAQKAAPGKPENGGGWRLSVKRGRDGKDYTKDGTPTPREPVRLK